MLEHVDGRGEGDDGDTPDDGGEDDELEGELVPPDGETTSYTLSTGCGVDEALAEASEGVALGEDPEGLVVGWMGEDEVALEGPTFARDALGCDCVPSNES